jgi:Nucleoside-diphosphate-sugar pyrophosphorylase involved in lipopolysaccharide biosynthesis/translation initiation factor 2B, gamma/epsilon subunits (eIF-2Bgamma/eIF-2Bepsilon)
MDYRQLTDNEIKIMEQLGCSCKNWDLVEVAQNFLPDRVRESSFSGYIKLGRFEKEFLLPGGIVKKSGIRNVAFHNVVVGDNCYIENVHNYVANYNIGEGTFIENVDVIAVDGVSSFGNGIAVKVLNEVGGREVFIHNKLSSQLAYFSALYRHRPRLIEAISDLTKFYVKKHSSDKGVIGKNSFIINTGKILNVYIGDNCKIDGTSVLENGTINSCKEAPVYVGIKVRAKNFIIMCGSSLDTGCCIENCFVGQNTKLANNYSATESVFFANCHGENGEACSIFAGPFTVTHHRSSLLIAGLFSFMNTGSGSNQSNHMYKLGPIHQGIMERGSKTSSDSYILWPAHVGAFSLVMGRHVFHSDTSNFPFSYLIEKKIRHF